MIEVRDLSVRYGGEVALRNLSFNISAGECVLVTGPSGCGKSTLARVLTGLIPHAIRAQLSGSVCIAGMDPVSTPVTQLARQVGSVFQNPSTQLFHLLVEDEVAFGPRNLGLSGEEVAQQVEWALAATGLTSLRRSRPAGLSGGQKQRVALAAALAMRPQVLVLDEPTASLDVPGTGQVINALHALREQMGLTIILIEHRLAEAARLASRTIVLDQGGLVSDGPSQAFLVNRALQRRLGLRRPIDEPLSAWENLLQPNHRPPVTPPPLLQMKQVSAGYNGHPVIHAIDLELFPGEFVALVGDNGTGKSTLALAAAGLIKPLAGRVLYSQAKKFRPGLDTSLLFQNPAEQLFTDSVGEEVAFGPNNYGRFDGEFHKQVLAEADLVQLAARRPQALSVGQQQRTALAACLSLRPGLLILDEPTLGQDWGHLERLMNFLTRLNGQGVTILLITHDYKLVHRYARRVLLLRDGRVVLDGSLQIPLETHKEEK